ncbi:hypothetical protein LSH36_683g03156 [Paralvinella palmiformis]|uniref:Uncharacterized protein n=1 Tax=Paralvinella palmiformis TaxID=53620 RepID=A0AAD9MVI1_9ANNE|nr:hypothetical protein LSH36_683g03156 [Paralvinella palmiformis]
MRFVFSERSTFPDQVAHAEIARPSSKRAPRKSPGGRSAFERGAARSIVESFWESFETSTVYCKKATRRRHRRQQIASPDHYAKSAPLEANQRRTEGEHLFIEQANVYCAGSAPTDCDQSDSRPSGDKTSNDRPQIVHWLSELASHRLSKRKRNPKKNNRPQKKDKKHRILKRKGVQLFGPELEDKDERSDENASTASLLLQQLDIEVARLKRDRVALSKQMWLLFSSFEEFLRSRYPKTAAGIKRYAKIGPETTTGDQSRDISIERKQNGQISGESATYNWIDESTHLYSNVAEVGDWLRPTDECDDWSDDSDRVRKLTKTDECAAEPREIVTDENCNNVGKDAVDSMNILWYTKLKKIDKSSSRRFRNRTPERKHWQSPDGFSDSNTSVIKIDTPVRRPEDLFDQSTPNLEGNPTVERQSRGDCPIKFEAEKTHIESNEDELTMAAYGGPVSPVTISSGYDSDRDALREADMDGVLYGLLPGYKKGTPNRDANRSPMYVAMADTSAGKLYENLKNCSRRPESLANTSRSLQDLSVAKDDTTILVDNSNLSLSRSLDDLLTDSDVVKGLREIPMSCTANTWKDGDKFNDCVDDYDKENTCIYENLPTALYAQVSPPKPQLVYGTPTCLKADPMWESTPLDDSHKPKIINVSGASDNAGSQQEGSLQSQIRKRIKLLLEDKSGAQTPYKSAFRPYNKVPSKIPIAEKLNIHQDQSIAELRRTNVLLNNSHYLYMSPSRSDILRNSPSLHSVLVGDFSVQPADMDRSRFGKEYTLRTTTESDKSMDTDRGNTGNSDTRSPLMPNNAFVNLKDSRIIHKDKLYRSSDMFDSESEFNNTYESIPADIETFWNLHPDKSQINNGTSLSEHTYCKIGDIPTMLEPTGYFKVPEPPPCIGRSSLQKRNEPQRRCIQNPTQKVNNRIPAGKQSRMDDVRESSHYHKYTVSEVLRSFEKYAGHLMDADTIRDNGSKMLDCHVIPAPDAFNQAQRLKPSSLPGKECVMVTNKSDNVEVLKYAKQPSRAVFSTISDQTKVAKGHVNDFTPGFSDACHHSKVPGPQYSAGGGVKLAAIKKTLSFRDLPSPNSVESLCHFRQRSEPIPDASLKSGRNPRHPRSFCARMPVDYTPTVIDGLQSYQTTPTDVTTELIISPPSAFRSRSSPEEHLYENIRDMEFMREKRRKAVEEGRAYRTTPLHRTQSGLHIHRIDFDDAREIFC